MARASKASTSTSKKKSTSAKSSKSASKKATSTKKSTSKEASTKKAAPKKSTSASKSASKKSSSRRPKSPFTAKFLDQMQKLLHVEREVYERQATQLRAEAASLVADLDPGDVQFDEESGEGDTIAVERNRDLALASKAVEMIEEIDHALSKFDEGTYGICEVSGEPIPEERLEAIPWARERVEHKVGGFGRR